MVYEMIDKCEELGHSAFCDSGFHYAVCFTCKKAWTPYKADLEVNTALPNTDTPVSSDTKYDTRFKELYVHKKNKIVDTILKAKKDTILKAGLILVPFWSKMAWKYRIPVIRIYYRRKYKEPILYNLMNDTNLRDILMRNTTDDI
jgi:hypothetical protein